MHRVFGLLIITSIALGLYLLLAGPDAEPGIGQHPQLPTPFAYGGWAAGLCMGLCLAWLAGLDWRNLPDKITAWVRLQRHRLGWVLIGGVCTGILLLL